MQTKQEKSHTEAANEHTYEFYMDAVTSSANIDACIAAYAAGNQIQWIWRHMLGRLDEWHDYDERYDAPPVKDGNVAWRIKPPGNLRRVLASENDVNVAAEAGQSLQWRRKGNTGLWQDFDPRLDTAPKFSDVVWRIKPVARAGDVILHDAALKAMEAVELDYFRSVTDVGAHPLVMLVWNDLRIRVGLPELRVEHLAAHDGESYKVPDGSLLIAETHGTTQREEEDWIDGSPDAQVFLQARQIQGRTRAGDVVIMAPSSSPGRGATERHYDIMAYRLLNIPRIPLGPSDIPPRSVLRHYQWQPTSWRIPREVNEFGVHWLSDAGSPACTHTFELLMYQGWLIQREPGGPWQPCCKLPPIQTTTAS